MNVVTFSRQLGSEGDWIAHTVAQTLGYAYMDHAIINRAAREAGVPEVALAQIDELNFLGLRPTPKAHRAYLDRVHTILQELADHGHVVIVGCGAQVVLRSHPQVLHVQIVAPFAVRVARLMGQERISEDAAINRLIASDNRRSTYLRNNYGVNWLDPSLYDLVISTNRMTRESAATIILQIMRGHNV